MLTRIFALVLAILAVSALVLPAASPVQAGSIACGGRLC
jgi:hypothetical protein